MTNLKEEATDTTDDRFSNGFSVAAADEDSPNESFASDDFWGPGRQHLQDGMFDFTLQRWYEEPKKCPKFPLVPVTDLQNLLWPERATKYAVSVVPSNRGLPCVSVATSRKLQIPAGVQIEILAPKNKSQVADESNAKNGIAENEVFDRNYKHQHAYNQAAVGSDEVKTEKASRNDFTKDVMQIYRRVFPGPGETEDNQTALKTIGESPPSELRPIGKRDTDPSKTPGQLVGGRYYPPSDLPKLDMRIGIPESIMKPLGRKGSAAGKVDAVGYDWSPAGWTIEDGGWEAPHVIPSLVNIDGVPSLSNSSITPYAEPIKLSNVKALPFPQNDFCTDINLNQSFAKDKKVADMLISRPNNKGALLRVAVPSGAVLHIPLAAAKMFDHGFPGPAVAEHDMTLANVSKRLGKEQNSAVVNSGSALNMVDDVTPGASRERPSLILKQQKYADLTLARPLLRPTDVGEVRAASVDDDTYRQDIVYPNLDLEEFIQIEQASGAEDYATLKRLVKEITDPLPVPPKFKATMVRDERGNAHECMRQYLKDHKMDSTAQQLSEEWYLHHNERCDEFPHDLKPYGAASQYLDLAQNHQLLLREYKTVKNSERKKTRLLNQCHVNARFMTLNFKRYAAKNAKLQGELQEAQQVSPADVGKLVKERNFIDQRFKGMRQLNQNLHAQLKASRVQVGQLDKKLENVRHTIRYRQSRKKNPKDSLFPDYHGLNPLGFLSRKIPAQLLKLSGMSIQQKTPAHTRTINDMAINPYRHMVITAGADGQWRAWNIKAMGKPLSEGNGHNGSIYRTAYHPSGLFFATAGMDAVVNFWNTDDGSKRLKVQHLDSVTAISFHSSGDFMLTGCNNGKVALWDLNSQRCLSHLCRWNNIDHVHRGAIANCQIIPYSNMCITASEDGDVRLWDLRSESNHIIMSQSQPIRNAKVALNGDIMGTSSKYDSDVKLWDLRKLGQLVAVANYPPQYICDFNFDTSCHLMAMGLNNGQVNFWDVKTGTSTVYPAHNSSTTVVTWDIWGEYLLSGDEQGNIFLWS